MMLSDVCLSVWRLCRVHWA